MSFVKNSHIYRRLWFRQCTGLNLLRVNYSINRKFSCTISLFYFSFWPCNNMFSFFNMMKDDDRPLIGPNYWIIKNMGLLLPENKLKRIVYIMLHEIVTLFVFTQFMELWVIRSDLDLVLTNVKISMLSGVCVIKMNAFFLCQSKWRDILNYVTDADKFERQSRDLAKVRIIDVYTKYCHRLTKFYCVLTTTTFLTTVNIPVMRYLSSTTYRENFRNGTEEFPHIFSSWMPFDKNTFPGSWLTVLWHVLLCAYGAAIMAAYDTTVVVIIVFFGGKLDLLRERCKQMLGTRSNKDVVRQVHQIHKDILK